MGHSGLCPRRSLKSTCRAPSRLRSLPAAASARKQSESSARGGDRDGVATGSKGGGGNDGQTERPSSSSLPRSRESRGAMPAVPSSRPPEAPRRTLRPSRLFTALSHRPSRPRCLRGRRWGGLRSPRAPRIQCLPLPLLTHPPRGQSQTQHCLGGGGSQLGGDFVSSGPDTLWRHFDRHSWCGVGATGIRQVEARDAARLPAGHRTVQTRRPAHTSTVPEPGAPALNGLPGLAPSPCPPPSQGNTS